MKRAAGQLRKTVERAVASTRIDDIHTHLYDPAFGPLLLWGIDDLLVYHYLVAEAFRGLDIPYETFWKLSKSEQAETVWEQLFVRHSPVSEACRGVLTTLNKLGLDPRRRDLKSLRKWFAGWTTEKFTDRCIDLAGLNSICMTNSPFDDLERPIWENGFKRHERFKAALRIDPLLLQWEATAPKLRNWGFDVRPALGAKTFSEVRRFLAQWSERMEAEFLMVSLPPQFEYPSKDACAQLIEKAVLPHCLEHNLPFAVMPGVKRAVNSALQLAGDGVGLSDLSALQNLCAAHPRNKFLCTALARENQHELCVLARKFRNLHIFGCWWFTNIPLIIEEMTRMRLELLGFSFTAQHSDARVLDQIIYKWDHSRAIVANVLAEKYEAMGEAGWEPSSSEVQRDVQALFGGAYREFLGLSL